MTWKQKLTVLMILHVLWGLALWFSISKYGLGISTDSVHLLFGALNLSAGRGLFSFDGTFVLFWPPLYPALLALIHLVSGLDPFISAGILQTIAFLGMSICLAMIYLEIFPDSFWLAVAGSILSDIGVVVLTSFDVVGSDYVHLFFVVLYLLLTGYYIKSKSARLLLAMSAVGIAVALQRYLGIAALATGATMVFFFSDGELRRRTLHTALLALSALPAGIWLLVTSVLINRRMPVSFVENFKWFSLSILQWWLSIDSKQTHLWLYIFILWLLIAATIFFLIRFSGRHTKLSPLAIAFGAYAMFYTLALFGSASIAYFNKLSGRFLLPLYIPFVLLLILASDVSLQLLRDRGPEKMQSTARVGSIVALILIAIGLLRITIPAALLSQANGTLDGNDFNNRAWRENSLIQYLRANRLAGDFLLFSNYPDGIAFYTRHSAYNSPARYSGPYGKVEFPVDQYRAELFSSGRAVYLVWIEPNIYPYYYHAEDLSSIAVIEPVFVDRDGGIYLLKPIPSPGR